MSQATPRLRAGVVGAGNICELHVRAVRALPDVELIGVTDLDPARRRAAEDKLDIKSFATLDELVAAGANVIHVCTPPSSHAQVAMAALAQGCHVLIETPVAADVGDVAKIAARAKAKGLVATVDHSLLFDPQVMRALEAVRSGSLGTIVSVDILRGSSFPTYQGGPLPAWYRDASYAFRDLGVHCLYLIQELLGPIEQVDGEWRSVGGDPNLAFDDWRTTVRCKRGLGQFQLSWSVKPMQHQIIIHGTKAVRRVDLLARLPPMPRAAERLINGVWKLLRKEVQSHQGIRNLIADFYRRLAAGDPPAVSIEDAAVVVGWVEQVARAAEADHARRLARFPVSPTAPYVVTGASGSLGGAIVRRLLSEGKKVRAMVRRIPERPLEGVEYVFGNLGDPEAVDRAIKGGEIVIHVGAATKGGWPEHYGGTVIGTRNVIESVKRHTVKQLVHISSMSVIDWAGSSGGAPVSEQTALEPRADERGAYTRAKLEAEKLVVEAAARGLPAVILRPGQIFGGGIPLVNGAVARRAAGRWLILGDGKLTLPLVYIEDVVDAVQASIARKLTRGEVIQIIDGEPLTQEDVLGIVGNGSKVLRVPRSIVFALGKLSEYPLGALKRQSPVALYRLQSALARLRFESDLASTLLGWRPRVGVREGIRREQT